MSEQTTNRIFVIGASRIVADASMQNLDKEAVRTILKVTYPEVEHATIRESQLEDGTECWHFLAKPGRKG